MRSRVTSSAGRPTASPRRRIAWSGSRPSSRRQRSSVCRPRCTARPIYPIRSRSASLRRPGAARPHGLCLRSGHQDRGRRQRCPERNRVLEVQDGEPCSMRTEHGTVQAGEVIVATNLPVVPQGEFHKKTSPRAHSWWRHPSNRNARRPACISAWSADHSIRTVPFGDRRLLIVVGESFAPGTVTDTRRCTASFARSCATVGVAESVAQWRTWTTTARPLPFVGRGAGTASISGSSQASAPGASAAAPAGMILADAITGRENPWAGLSTPPGPRARRKTAASRRCAR